MSRADPGWVTLVTGAAHGIGAAVAEAAGNRGDRLVLVDVDAEGLLALCCQGTGGVIRVAGDVKRGDTWDAAVREAEAVFGGVDALVHNAGGSGGLAGRPLEEVSDAEWDAVVELNLRSAFLGARAVAPIMKRQQRGRIVFIGSETVRTGTMSGIQAYPAAKAGLSGLARQLAFELGPFGITVNVVAPGLVISSDRVRSQWERRPPEERAAHLQRIPLRRLGTPADIADVVVFMASEQARYMTGQTIFVDGGHAAL